MKNKGFTLIELIVIVAIIVILTTIALPKFLKAQVRTKVSRANSEMKILAAGIEAYYVDNECYPMVVAKNSIRLGGEAPASSINGPSLFNPGKYGVSSRFLWITTPIAYIPTVFRDPFIDRTVGVALSSDGALSVGYDTYDYGDAKSVSPEGILGPEQDRGAASTSGAAWHIVSSGPDRIIAFGGSYVGVKGDHNKLGVDYDPSNGTVSTGDIVRIADKPGKLWGTKVPAIDRVNKKYNF
jgi:general secretion pathway protein G